MRKQKIAYLWMLFICISFCGCRVNSGEMILIGNEEGEVAIGAGRETESEPGSESDDGAKEAQVIYVYVCGAVVSAGVVELPSGSRAQDALEAAGGFAENACRNLINLAEKLYDGQMLYFPTQEEADAGWGKTGSIQDIRVNINTADVDLLCTLPGIGKSRAQEILVYRQKNGLFETCEDIMSVPGIKSGIYDKISRLITVGER